MDILSLTAKVYVFSKSVQHIDQHTSDVSYHRRMDAAGRPVKTFQSRKNLIWPSDKSIVPQELQQELGWWEAPLVFICKCDQHLSTFTLLVPWITKA